MRLMHLLNKLNVVEIVFDLFKTIFIYLIATIFALCVVEADVISDNVFGVYMLAVAVTSITTNGYIWGILSSVGGVIGVNFFFTFPYFALNFTLAGYPITFTILLMMSILTSAMMANVKKAAIISETGKQRADSLNNMSKAFLLANDMNSLLEAALNSFYTANQCSTIIYIGEPLSPEMKAMKVRKEYDEAIFDSLLEKQVAQKAYETNEASGFSVGNATQNCKGLYLPIASKDKTYGVLGLLLREPKFILEPAIAFSSVMISQTILAIERQEMIAHTQEIILEKEKEKMRSNLLRAVSHDLRTPLTCIIGASTTLKENKAVLTEENQMMLLADIQQDAEWLIHMVENLLTITRISGQDTKLKKQEEIVEEVVSEVVTRLRKRFPQSQVEVSVPDEILIAPMDPTLIKQVLMNLIENAIRHSGSTKPIQLRVTRQRNSVRFTVSDSGVGIAPERFHDLFSGIRNAQDNDSTRGLGIGLSICKTIIMAHDGKIFATNNETGGASFIFALPMKGEHIDVNEG